MEKIQIAKKNAETYLSNIINQSWEGDIKSEWPLRFEAHAYLGNRHKELIPKFGKELRLLWRNWIELYKKGELGYRKIFWPAVDVYCIPVGHEEAEWEPGFEIENHIAMFRAKENLCIEGFETYFNEAKKRLRSLLIEEDVLKSSDKNRIIYQIVRSPMLRLLLKNCIKNLASRIIEEEYLELESEGLEFKKRGIIVKTGFWARAIFFLIISNLEGEYEKLAIEILKTMIDGQENNGSFNDDILTTCLAISSIYIMGLDLYGIICEEAIKWLLYKQNEDGSWKHWRLSMCGLPPESHVLATVVVLETLDLIKNDEPLPIWTKESRQYLIYQEKKLTRIQPIVLFKVPHGINWHDVSIRFTSDMVVQIRAGDASEGRDFIGMGFENRRNHEPDLGWTALIELGNHQGIISYKDDDIDLRIKRNLKYYVHLVRIRLTKLFNIHEDPFKPYNVKTKSWETKFIIRYDVHE